jgi:hypothetical protein
MYVVSNFWYYPVFIVVKPWHQKSVHKCLTDSERAALVNSVVDSDDSTDEDDSDASGDTGSTDTCVWKDIIIYIG